MYLGDLCGFVQFDVCWCGFFLYGFAEEGRVFVYASVGLWKGGRMYQCAPVWVVGVRQCRWGVWCRYDQANMATVLSKA